METGVQQLIQNYLHFKEMLSSISIITETTRTVFFSCLETCMESESMDTYYFKL